VKDDPAGMRGFFSAAFAVLLSMGVRYVVHVRTPRIGGCLWQPETAEGPDWNGCRSPAGMRGFFSAAFCFFFLGRKIHGLFLSWA